LFTLIDMADFGYGPYMADGGEDDVKHFIDGLSQLSTFYGEDVIAHCEKFFRQGYDTETKRGRAQTI